MTSASMEMSASAKSVSETPHARLDEAIDVLHGHAREFARLGATTRASLLRDSIPHIRGVARAWAEAGARAKGLDPASASAGEEWLGGPLPTMRNTRLLIRALDEIALDGKPRLPARRFSMAPDGVTQVEVFPGDGFDGVLFSGFTARVRMKPGMSESDVREQQASWYSKRDPDGGVSLVLGAGNVSSIPPMDALYKMFVDGSVCLVKMNPVNEYLAQYFEEAFRPLVDRGYLRVVLGGGDVGGYLTQHASISDVHITGSDRTHDLIVWGPPGPERARRLETNDPLLKKPITSELGCVTPVIVVPGPYTDREIAFLGENIATAVVNNASCNCNAAKMLVTSKHWPQREALLARVRAILSTVPPRKAYYPGASDRFHALLDGRANVERLGDEKDGLLPWALVFGLDGKSESERLFTTEPFCPILSEAMLDARDPAEFLGAATTFCNERLWGTLSAMLVIHPMTERAPDVKSAFDRSIATLRYGAVGVNHWPGLVYGTVTPPWGAHPSSTLKDIQGGLGWVHNTFMLEGIEKTVLRGPLIVKPKPPWFVTNTRSRDMGEKLVEFEASPSWLKVPGVALTAFGG